MADTKFQYVVIGSGLSALSGVLALLDRGIRPLVIDCGTKVSEKQTRKVHYDEKIFKQLKDYATRGHVYASPFAEKEVSLPNSPIAISSGIGGLSNVWGGGWQPINSEQYKWFSPVVARQMQEASEKLLSYFNYSGLEDELNKRFPMPNKNTVQHFCKVEYDEFNKRRRGEQFVDGVLFGFPRRLHCGQLCAHKHSHSEPLNAAHYFESLRKSNLIDFKEMRVLEIKKSSSLKVIGYSHGDLKNEIHCEKILLAAGTVASSAIILRSLQTVKEVEIHDSQVFYLAFLSLRKSPFGNREKSEAFGNLISSKKHTSQPLDFSCSLIGPSKDFRVRITNQLPFGIGRFFTNNHIVHRIYMSIGFIDQAYSGKILIEKEGNELKTKLVNNPNCQFEIRKIRRLLRRWGLKRNMLMLPQFLTPRSKVGSGFHSGAISKMQNLVNFSSGKNDISELQTLKGVCLIDTSTLPKIPAGAHTFIAMVNAYRVGTIV